MAVPVSVSHILSARDRLFPLLLGHCCVCAGTTLERSCRAYSHIGKDCLQGELTRTEAVGGIQGEDIQQWRCCDERDRQIALPPIEPATAGSPAAIGTICARPEDAQGFCSGLSARLASSRHTEW